MIPQTAEHSAVLRKSMHNMLMDTYARRRDCDLMIALIQRYLIEIERFDNNTEQLAWRDGDIAKLANVLRDDAE